MLEGIHEVKNLLIEFYKYLPSDKHAQVISYASRVVSVLGAQKDIFKDEGCKISPQISFKEWPFAINFNNREYQF